MANTDDISKIRLCRVLSVDDPQAGGRIQVRFTPEDSDITEDNNLPWCFPFMPKMFHCKPKRGETVIVLAPEAPKANRFYIGPIISQDYNLFAEKNQHTSKMFLGTGGVAKPLPKPATDPENDGTYPDDEDIAVRGRGNTDVILHEDQKENRSDIRIRCGFKKYCLGPAETALKFNDKDLAYILMRYKKSKDHRDKEYTSSVNIVADRINLLSHDTKTPFDLGDKQNLITDEQMKLILEKAYRLPYGDILVDFLKDFIDVFKNHEHSWAQQPPSLSDDDKTVLNPNWDDMLSQSVRIN